MRRTLVFISFLVSVLLFSGCRIQKDDLSQYVNVFIGTGGHGHTFPGATLPYGMVQLSPDTRMSGWDACSGYHYSDSTIIGFSHTHLSGTGIGDYGDILVMPMTEPVRITRGEEADPSSGYRSGFARKNEIASPGYYSVILDKNKIKAELTATARTGFHRYTYPEPSDKKMIIDLNHTLQMNPNIVNEIKVLSNTEIQGLKVTRGWARNQYVYFYAKVSAPFTHTMVVNDSLAGNISEVRGRNVKLLLDFDAVKDKEILLKVGISAVDYDGAKRNLVTENPGWDFDKICEQAREQWNKALSGIQVEGGDGDQKVIFYSALYHTLICPNIFSDVDGRYRGIDQIIHNSGCSAQYTVFSLWDTFRAAHPLLTIIHPSRDAEMIESLLRDYENGGILPMWELAGNYTGTMIGYHSVPVIVDAYRKGIRDFNIEEAYKAMLRSSHYDRNGIKASSGSILNSLMPGGILYNDSLGFIPSDKENNSVAKALEYAYDDWCISQMAKELGKEDDYTLYSERAQRYRQYYDPSTGFMRGRLLSGAWRTPFNPKYSDHSSDDYVEGTAWQWTWFVPQDIPGLIGLTGGKDRFIQKLDSLFTTSSELEGTNVSPDISGMIGQYAHGNEPSHHIIYLYNYAGQPFRTQELADTILRTLYFNDPGGLSGNEDCGQMSAWFVLNAMGFYSVTPGDPVYSIGRPLFDKVTVSLQNGKKFRIIAEDNSTANKYVQQIFLDGVKTDKPFFSHENILKGSTLVLQMGPEPSK
jgi:predicted alpha-1,2-mannosidase